MNVSLDSCEDGDDAAKQNCCVLNVYTVTLIADKHVFLKIVRRISGVIMIINKLDLIMPCNILQNLLSHLNDDRQSGPFNQHINGYPDDVTVKLDQWFPNF